MSLRACLRPSLLGCAVVGLLAVTALPASAQVMDFFCSTLSVGCEPPPPPPPPAPMVEAPAPEPMKKVAHKKVKPKKVAKVEKKTAAPAEAAAPAAK